MSELDRSSCEGQGYVSGLAPVIVLTEGRCIPFFGCCEAAGRMGCVERNRQCAQCLVLEMRHMESLGSTFAFVKQV